MVLLLCCLEFQVVGNLPYLILGEYLLQLPMSTLLCIGPWLETHRLNNLYPDFLCIFFMLTYAAMTFGTS